MVVEAGEGAEPGAALPFETQQRRGREANRSATILLSVGKVEVARVAARQVDASLRIVKARVAIVAFSDQMDAGEWNAAFEVNLDAFHVSATLARPRVW